MRFSVTHGWPDMVPISVETTLIGEKWRKISWRRGTKGPLTCLFAARRVRIADGPKHRIFDKGVERMPGDEVWILGERRPGGEQKYYVSNLPAGVPLRTLAGAVKARGICEQAHQQLKEELGLDHFEGRSWSGLHRHALMTMIAYAFLQSRRLTAAGRKKKNQQRAAATAEFAGRAERHPRTLSSTTKSTMPVLQKTNRQNATA